MSTAELRRKVAFGIAIKAPQTSPLKTKRLVLALRSIYLCLCDEPPDLVVGALNVDVGS